MTLDAAVTRSRDLVARWWHVVADRCPDPRLARSSLQPVEGLNGHRALDLDRRCHIDSFAVAGGRWTPLSTRFQAGQYAGYRSTTFRHTEVRYLRDLHDQRVELGADLQVQMYGDDDELLYVLVGALGPVAHYYANTPLEAHYWRAAPTGEWFTYLTKGGLESIGGFVWHCTPSKPEQMVLL